MSSVDAAQLVTHPGAAVASDRDQACWKNTPKMGKNKWLKSWIMSSSMSSLGWRWCIKKGNAARFCGAVLWKLNSCGGWCDDSRSLGCVLLEKKTSGVLIIDSGSQWLHPHLEVPNSQFATTVHPPPSAVSATFFSPLQMLFFIHFVFPQRDCFIGNPLFVPAGSDLLIQALILFCRSFLIPQWPKLHVPDSTNTHLNSPQFKIKAPCAAFTLPLAERQLAVFTQTCSLFSWLW